MKKAVCLFVMITLLAAGAAFAESSEAEVPAVLTEEYSLEDFTVSISSEWIMKDAEDPEKTLLSAETIDHQQFLVIFLADEGDDDRAVEMAAMNEYTDGILRTGAEDVNGIKMTYAETEDPKAAYAYFSVNNHVYTVSMSSLDQDKAVEELREKLHETVQTITANAEK